MVTIRKMAFAGATLFGVALGALASTATLGTAAETGASGIGGGPAQTAAPAVAAPAPAYILSQPEHWTDKHLRSLEADSTTERSIYLSAVQLVELERNQGDVRRVIPALEGLAKRTPTQQLKNAINRLLVDICLETKDFKAAEKYLNTIVEGSLVQY